MVKTDRGGQITYHGPGPDDGFTCFDLSRAGYGVRELVQRIERGVIDLLAVTASMPYGKRGCVACYVRPERRPT